MNFAPTNLSGAFLIRLDRRSDERGFFARTFCKEEFMAHGLPTEVAQCSVSHNATKGTLRGMHFQAGNAAEAKLVRCTKGSIFDVIIDLRPGSPTYARWYGTELSAENGDSLFVPKRFAHGFQTLMPDTDVAYQMFDFFKPNTASGVRWDDPAFGITWPDDVRTISERDRTYPDFRP